MIVKTNYKQFRELLTAADQIGMIGSIQRIGSSKKIKKSSEPGKPPGKKRKKKPVAITEPGPLLPMQLPAPSPAVTSEVADESARRSATPIQYQLNINGDCIKTYNKRLSAKQRFIKEYNRAMKLGKYIPPKPKKK